MTKIVYPLHKGRSKRTILEIIPDDDGLYRIAWPDIGLSDRANLTRCKQAALEWAHNQSSPPHTRAESHAREIDPPGVSSIEQPTDCRSVDSIRARHVGLRLAFVDAGDRFLLLVTCRGSSLPAPTR